jgi:hypothetical protein
MGIPTLTLAHLLAYRDGEDLIGGFQLGLRHDPGAQLRLLEHRLLALAFTMPWPPELPPSVSQRSAYVERPKRWLSLDRFRLFPPVLPSGMKSAPPPRARTEGTDSALLERYVTGALSGRELEAYENSVRGNPHRLAELIDFKNDFFGRARRALKRKIPEAPRPDREELGVLALRRIEGQIFLTWRASSEREDGLALLAAAETIAPFKRSSTALDALYGVDERLRALQDEVNDRIERLRAQLFMTLKGQELPPLLELLEAMGELAREQELLAQRMHELRDAIADTVARRTQERLDEEDGGPWSRGYAFDTRLARLAFTLDQRGMLSVRVIDAAPELELTWIRPGVTFEALEAQRGAHHALGRVDHETESLLLLSARGERSAVVRVAWG